MNNDEAKSTDSSLMKMVQAISISPEDARSLVHEYDRQLQSANPNWTEKQRQDLLVEKIVSRYAKLAATTGGATALAGVVPGIGTAISMVGGTVADISVCIKFQVDMVMCLTVALNREMHNEDAKNLSYVIALYGSLEQAGSKGATKIATKAGVKMINTYLKGPLLVTIKELFKKIGITFTQKAATKVIPFGIGVVIGAGSNYVLTKYVGKNAIEFLRIRATEAV